jgi:mitochondrial fission protein ELM1
MDSSPIDCWVVTEGKAGMESQCLGVAEALGVTPTVKRIGLRQPWKTLAPYLGFECAASFTGDAIDKDFPRLVIACGRKGFSAARYIKRASKGKSFVVYIQDPRVRCPELDLIVVPEHDPLRDANVLVTTAAPNRVSSAWISHAREDFTHLLSPLPGPRVALLIGGTSAAYNIEREELAWICDTAKMAVPRGGSLMVTASRRTGPENLAFLKEQFFGSHCYFWDGKGANPYGGYLAWADYFIVTPDSVSMISEAASTGRPVYLLPLPGGADRIRKFHHLLESHGTIRWLKPGEPLVSYEYMPLSDAARVAGEIRERMAGV